MSSRIDPDKHPNEPPSLLAGTASPAALAAVDSDDRFAGGHHLPTDHPVWLRDRLSISQRARALVATLRPVAIKVIAFWEHRVRSIAIGNGRLSVDASGSYRFD